jgi:transcriptional regulator with XRE-family HTH domain
MQNIEWVVSPAQCRAARAILNWSQTELAAHANVARRTIADFELGRRGLQLRTRRGITDALVNAGITFSDAQGVSFGPPQPAPGVLSIDAS